MEKKKMIIAGAAVLVAVILVALIASSGDKAGAPAVQSPAHGEHAAVTAPAPAPVPETAEPADETEAAPAPDIQDSEALQETGETEESASQEQPEASGEMIATDRAVEAASEYIRMAYNNSENLASETELTKKDDREAYKVVLKGAEKFYTVHVDAHSGAVIAADMKMLSDENN